MVAFDSRSPDSTRLDSTVSFTRPGRGALHVERDETGGIREVRIAGWRILRSSPLRRIAEVREFSAGRIAVLSERFVPAGSVSLQVWQMYNAAGRLTAAVHAKPDGTEALLMNYQTREACRLAPDDRGQLETVAAWRF
ncbi:MAG: hypothetical protein KF688_17130 [Pirellulales bacterium]|nr:hypothetical protein [Pirellulales bacterium]